MSRITTNSTKFPNEYERKVDLTESEQHRLLSSARRRLVLDILEDRPDSITLEGLAVAITRRNDSLDSDEETVQRVKTTLHHVHLPKMADFGVLNYDVELRRVDP